jgi:hypothetical protein
MSEQTRAKGDTDDDIEILAAEEEDTEIMFLQADIQSSYDSIEERIDEIKKRAKEFFEEKGWKVEFEVDDHGHLQRVEDEPDDPKYEVQVDLQSFIMSLPNNIGHEDIDKIRDLAVKQIEKKAKDGEIYLDQVFVEET